MGFDFLATGHYAAIGSTAAGLSLDRPTDKAKDQTYFLYCIARDDLGRILFPLGGLKKEEVRRVAREASLPVADKEESQDVCFIPDGDYAAFVGTANATSDGPIIDIRGKKIGTHHGIHHFTIGQRKGLGALGRPMFVKAIIPQTKTVVAATGEELYTSRMIVRDLNMHWQSVGAGDTCLVQIRYRSPAVGCSILELEPNCMVVGFHEPARAVAPGQAAVFYRGEAVIGGGTIESAE
jgi:tRNA-specific 2-thiouridylase